jgi:hypothetical protein
MNLRFEWMPAQPAGVSELVNLADAAGDHEGPQRLNRSLNRGIDAPAS